MKMYTPAWCPPCQYSWLESLYSPSETVKALGGHMFQPWERWPTHKHIISLLHHATQSIIKFCSKTSKIDLRFKMNWQGMVKILMCVIAGFAWENLQQNKLISPALSIVITGTAHILLKVSFLNINLFNSFSIVYDCIIQYCHCNF